MESYGLKCRLSLPPNLLYDEAIKNVSLLEVNRDKKLSICKTYTIGGLSDLVTKHSRYIENREFIFNTFRVKIIF